MYTVFGRVPGLGVFLRKDGNPVILVSNDEFKRLVRNGCVRFLRYDCARGGIIGIFPQSIVRNVEACRASSGTEVSIMSFYLDGFQVVEKKKFLEDADDSVHAVITGFKKSGERFMLEFSCFSMDEEAIRRLEIHLNGIPGLFMNPSADCSCHSTSFSVDAEQVLNGGVLSRTLVRGISFAALQHCVGRKAFSDMSEYEEFEQVRHCLLSYFEGYGALGNVIEWIEPTDGPMCAPADVAVESDRNSSEESTFGFLGMLRALGRTRPLRRVWNSEMRRFSAV